MNQVVFKSTLTPSVIEDLIAAKMGVPGWLMSSILPKIRSMMVRLLAEGHDLSEVYDANNGVKLVTAYRNDVPIGVAIYLAGDWDSGMDTNGIIMAYTVRQERRKGIGKEMVNRVKGMLTDEEKETMWHGEGREGFMEFFKSCDINVFSRG